MDFIEQEDLLVEAGIPAEHARAVMRVVTSGDAQAMTRADGDKLEANLGREMDVRFEALDGKFEALEAKIERLFAKGEATSYRIGALVLGLLIAYDYFIT